MHDPAIRHVQQKHRLGSEDARIKRDRVLGVADAEIRDEFLGCHGHRTFVVCRTVRLDSERFTEPPDYPGRTADRKRDGTSGRRHYRAFADVRPHELRGQLCYNRVLLCLGYQTTRTLLRAEETDTSD